MDNYIVLKLTDDFCNSANGLVNRRRKLYKILRNGQCLKQFV